MPSCTCSTFVACDESDAHDDSDDEDEDKVTLTYSLALSSTAPSGSQGHVRLLALSIMIHAAVEVLPAGTDWAVKFFTTRLDYLQVPAPPRPTSRPYRLVSGLDPPPPQNP